VGGFVSEHTQRRLSGRSRWLVGFGLAYLVGLGFVALWPTTISEPFTRLLERIEDRSPGSVADLEFIANILLFVPAGVLLAVLLGPGRRRLAVALAVAVSVAIELVQGILLPARVASLGDIIANAAGALLGVWVAARAARAAPGGPQRSVG